MGWLGRKTSVGTLKSDIRQASGLPLDQRMQLASEMEGFIQEIRSVMQTPDHPSELMRLFQLHGANRKAQVPGGFSALWAHHAFRESYLLALIKAPDDPQWFEEVHTLLHGIRGPLGLFATDQLVDADDIRTNPQGPIPEYSHAPPAATSPPDDLVQQMSDSAPDQSQSSVLSCSECGHENPAEVNFCTKCRAKMTLECNKCGFKSPQGSEFCGSCGEETEFRVEKRARNAALAAAEAAARVREAEAQTALIPVERYFDNGHLEVKGGTKGGKSHGPYERYYKNGQLRSRTIHKNGEQHGPYEHYDENGKLGYRGTYNMGSRCGTWIVDGKTVTYSPCPPDLEDGN